MAEGVVWSDEWYDLKVARIGWLLERLKYGQFSGPVYEEYVFLKDQVEVYLLWQKKNKIKNGIS